MLRLKDGTTRVQRHQRHRANVNNRLFDAVSDMTGDQTQGELGPDGAFTINNLTPGQDYEVYIEQILAGGYPTPPQSAGVAGGVLECRGEPQSGDGPPRAT